MFWIYILQSEKNGRYYIGSTNNIERRLSEHNSGKTRSLKFIRPLKLVFKKPYESESEVKLMERKLKKYKSREIIDRIVKEQEIKMGL